MTETSTSKFRLLTFGVTRVTLMGGDGTQYLSAEQPLSDYPTRASPTACSTGP